MTDALVMNIEGVRRSKDAENRIEEKHPLMVGFLQTYRAEPWILMMAAKHGYYRHHLRGQQERKNIAVLLKKDKHFDIMSVGYMFMEEDWIGGKAGHHHEPRVYVKVVTQYKDEPVTRTTFVHLPTDNADKAQAESVNRLVAHRNRHDDDDCVYLGDFNKEVHEMRPVAKRLNGDLKTVGKVDHGVFCQGKDRDANNDGVRDELRAWADSFRDEPGKMQPGAHGWGYYSWRRARVRS